MKSSVVFLLRTSRNQAKNKLMNFYLNEGGSSFIVRYKGHISNFVDFNRDTPSVFS